MASRVPNIAVRYFGLFVVHDWSLGTALRCANIPALLSHFLVVWICFGTSGKNVGRTDRNSSAAPSQLRLATPLERLPTDLPKRPSVIPRKQRLAAPRAHRLGDSGQKLSSWLQAGSSSIGWSGTNRIASCPCCLICPLMPAATAFQRRCSRNGNIGLMVCSCHHRSGPICQR